MNSSNSLKELGSESLPCRASDGTAALADTWDTAW